MRLIAIGDIHGCSRTMARLIKVLAPERDEHLVFLGDYIDRGPDSRAVIEQCLALKRQYRCTFLRGNHEAFLLGFLRGHGYRDWMANGGASTLRSYASGDGTIDIPPAHQAFVRATRTYLDTPDYFFVHGGLPPALTVAAGMRHCDESDFLWRRPPRPGQPVAWEKTVVFGHTPMTAPLRRPRMIGIDTGCVYVGRAGLGRLSAVRLPSEVFVSVANVDAPA